MARNRHSRAPLRRSSTPERILSAGLATATCVGVVGLLGARTIEANTASATADDTATAAAVEPVVLTAAEPTTSAGLTQADLDTYAAALAAEKERLDAYRAKLVRIAKKLQRQVDVQNAAATRSSSAAATSSSRTTTATKPSTAKPSATKPSTAKPPATKPAAKKPAAPAPAPAAKPAPQPQPAPAPAAQPAPQPQSNTKSS